MQLKIPKVKININNVVEMALSLGLVGAVGLGGFYILQHYFSFFSYQGMKREDVLRTRNEVESRLPILTRACGTTLMGDYFCRGIYLGQNGNMLYYRYEDDGKRNASYNLYSVPSELWDTRPSLLPARLVGILTQIGSSSTPSSPY